MPIVNPNTDWFILFESYVMGSYLIDEDLRGEPDPAARIFHFLIKEGLISEVAMKKYLVKRYAKDFFKDEGLSQELALEKLALIMDMEPEYITELAA